MSCQTHFHIQEIVAPGGDDIVRAYRKLSKADRREIREGGFLGERGKWSVYARDKAAALAAKLEAHSHPDGLTRSAARQIRCFIAENDRRLAAARAGIEKIRSAAKKPDPLRVDLLAAARAARSMGLDVRKSTDRQGRVSSYYVEFRVPRPSGWQGWWETRRTLRISDHDIPSTDARESRCGPCGFDGSADIYASADRCSDSHRGIWWRRALTLAVAGRSVPGGD